ncbi:hypothetical protein ABTW72_10445 [Micromonospora sp. NPDC127501]|uniref:hypothetical protein n=1 Tax=Micromonospora sp. NPDC127501 TaxID=3154872 RepID=UPI003324F120
MSEPQGVAASTQPVPAMEGALADPRDIPTLSPLRERSGQVKLILLKRIAELGEPRLGSGFYALLPVAAATAIILFLVLFIFLWILIAILSGFNAPNDRTLPAVLTASISMTALIGASLGAIYAFRKQVLAERDGLRADQQVYSDRYVKAAELLAHERPSARLAGLHSLAILADDWKEGRVPCVMAICSYLRLPTLDLQAENPDAGEREVRRTAWKSIRTRLLDPTDGISWHQQEFDFSGGHFDNVDLDLTRLNDARIQFRNCVFRDGELRLRATKLTDVVLDFTGSSFHNMKVMLQGAELNDGAVVCFDETSVTNSSFELHQMSMKAESHLLVRRAQISDSAFKFDADDEGFFFQRPASKVDGEVDFSESTLDRTRFSMHAYALTGRLVLHEVRTNDVRISVPSRISGDAYVNLDVVSNGPTEISIGPGKLEGGDLRIRPRGGEPKTLEVQFNTFELAGGEVLIYPSVPYWKRFRFDLIHEQRGRLVISGDFDEDVDLDIDRAADIREH